MPQWTLTVAERFWGKVDRKGPDECWPWTAASSTSGHGRFWRDGKLVVASRVAWELAHGPIPAGLFVLHRCDNPLCMNPDHLFLGTQQDNVADMVQKGRLKPYSACGENHHHAKFTDADVRSIRSDYRAGGVSQRELARRYNASQGAISDIVLGRRWAHVKVEP